MASTISQSRSIDVIGAQVQRGNGVHLYLQIADLIRRQIANGVLQAGDELPTQRELSARWGISEMTIRRSLQSLAAEGLVIAKPGAGTIVARSVDELERRRDPTVRETLSVGIAFASLADGYPFFRPIVAGLRDATGDVAVRLFDVPAKLNSERELNACLPLSGLDGLVMMSPINSCLLALSRLRQLPTVLLFSDVVDGFSHCIVPNYSSGIAQAVGHLVRRGRERIAIVVAGPERFSTGRWLEAFEAVIAAHGLEVRSDWKVTAGYGESDGAEATRRLLGLEHRPDAIIFASDFMARGGLLAALAAKVRVPQDLAIVGAGPVLEDGDWPMPMSSINLGLHEMGRRSRQVIEEMRDGIDAPPLRQVVPVSLLVGETA